MKMIQFHPASLLLGLAVGVGFVMLTSQTGALTTIPTMRVEAGPHPRDMIQINEGTPYVVPPGKYFVLTGLGRIEQAGSAILRVNGQAEVSSFVNFGNNGVYWSSSQNTTSIVAAPNGFTAHWGSTLEVVTTGTAPHDGRAWGYLADR